MPCNWIVACVSFQRFVDATSFIVYLGWGQISQTLEIESSIILY